MYKTTLHAPKPISAHDLYGCEERTIKTILQELSDALRAHHELEKRRSDDYGMADDLDKIVHSLRSATDRLEKMNARLAAKLNTEKS